MKRVVTTLLCLLAAAAAAAAAEQGAKGMFYEQLSHPQSTLNNGVQYWIELKRAGETTRMVNNKFQFKSGDQIRLHVRSNVDGFAYVVLREGSQGEHSVLFPHPKHRDDNHLKANIEYTIPSDSYLAFDENPGTERLVLVLSRKAIAPETEAPDKYKDKVVVASRIEGSKDLVPGSLVLSYGNDLPKPSSESEQAVITVVQKNPADALALEICLEHTP